MPEFQQGALQQVPQVLTTGALATLTLYQLSNQIFCSQILLPDPEEG